MGIKHFYIWFKNNFSDHISIYNKDGNFDVFNLSNNISIDNFMLDLNGIFHTCAQRIYKYGNFKEFGKKFTHHPIKTKNIRVFQEICSIIEFLTIIVAPRKRLILCIDGPAPQSKQNQQRQRRFRSSKDQEAENISFDSNCLTPGTEFMDHLSKYIDWYIRNNISEQWKHLEVIFSNEKVPGEGEHKIINYIRNHGNPTESFCIHGLDADLIMLSLGTHFSKFYVLRNGIYDYCMIDIGGVRKSLVEMMKWQGEFSETNIINDFIFLCFMVGNDFLPNIPTLEILEGGIDTIIDEYKNVCSVYGHITQEKNKKIVFNNKALSTFFKAMSGYEKQFLETKINKKGLFFPDILLEANASDSSEGFKVDFDGYRKDYYTNKFDNNTSIDIICNEYLDGMQWVLSYYTSSVESWSWIFPFKYAPFSCDLSKIALNFHPISYGKTTPLTPFQQLLSVLPPQSANLIPRPLRDLLFDEKSPLIDLYPRDFEIDLSGKRREWEGIVCLPLMDIDRVKKEYSRLIRYVNETEKKRDKFGKSFVYRYDSDARPYLFKSFYGDIYRCFAKQLFIEI